MSRDTQPDAWTHGQAHGVSRFSTEPDTRETEKRVKLASLLVMPTRDISQDPSLLADRLKRAQTLAIPEYKEPEDVKKKILPSTADIETLNETWKTIQPWSFANHYGRGVSVVLCTPINKNSTNSDSKETKSVRLDWSVCFHDRWMLDLQIGAKFIRFVAADFADDACTKPRGLVLATTSQSVDGQPISHDFFEAATHAMKMVWPYDKTLDDAYFRTGIFVLVSN
jgi:hypothetical protein